MTTEYKRVKHAQRDTEVNALANIKNRENRLTTDTKKWVSKLEDGTSILEGGASTRYVERFGTLAAAITAFGASNIDACISTTITLTADATIPANVTLRFRRGGSIALNGFTLTINGPFSAGLHQVFSGSGSVLFGPGYVERFVPQWWGGFPTNGTVINHTTYLQAACNAAAYGDYRRTVVLTGGYWYASGLDLSGKPITLEGENDLGTFLHKYDDTQGQIRIVNNTQTTGWTIRNIIMSGRLGSFGRAATVTASTTTAPTASDAYITDVGHPYSNNDSVLLGIDGSAVPAGGTAKHVLYYILNKTADTYQLSLTPGGAAIYFTASGAVNVERVFDNIYTELVTLSRFQHLYLAGARSGINLGANSTLCELLDNVYGSNNYYGFWLSSSGTEAQHRVIGGWVDENWGYGWRVDCRANAIIGVTAQDNSNAHIDMSSTSGDNQTTGCALTAGEGTEYASTAAIYNSGKRNSFVGNSLRGWSSTCVFMDANSAHTTWVGNGVFDNSNPPVPLMTAIQDAGGGCFMTQGANSFGFGRLFAPYYPVDVAGEGIRLNGNTRLRGGGTGAADADVELYRSAADVWTMPDALKITDTTASSSKDTGALVVDGGVGVEEDVYAGGQVVATGEIQSLTRTRGGPNNRAWIDEDTGQGRFVATNAGGDDIRLACLTTSGNAQMDINGGDQFEVRGGDIATVTAGKGLKIKEGSNAKQGTAVLVGGTVTVSTTAVTANSRIYLTSQVDGGTPGFLRVTAITAATSFVITSSSGADTSTVAWLIVEGA